MLNYFNDAELFVFLWIILSLAAGVPVMLSYFKLRDYIISKIHNRKSSEQLATDWVNKQIMREKRIYGGRR